MDAESPWGAPSFPPALPSHPSFNSPSLTFPSSVPAASGWGDDAGWGPASEEYESVGFGAAAEGGKEERVEEGLQRRVSVQRDKGNDTSGGWGISEDTHAAVVRPGEDEGRRDDTTSASPSLPPPSPVTRAYTPPPTSPKRKESDWGTYGTSPTFSVLPLPQPTNTASRDDGWGGDEEWQPEAVREAMPTFGSSFAGGEKVVEEEVEEGWGGERKWEGEQEVPQVSESVDRWEPQEQRSTRGKSIPAALVDDLKRTSRDFANSTWPVQADSWGTDAFTAQPSVAPLLTSLMQPPTLPLSSSEAGITATTPLPSLFRMTPTVYPAFRDGLDKTAIRAAETLKGTSSAAYRNARFGRGTTGRTARGEEPIGWDVPSSLASPPLNSDRGRAGDEFDLDAPSATPSTSKSSWWGGNSTAPAPPTTNMPKGLLTRKDSPDPSGRVSASSSPNPGSPNVDESSALGRFFGRLKRPPVVTAEEEGDDGIVDLDAIVVDLDRVNGRRLAGKGVEANVMPVDSLDSFFGEAPKLVAPPKQATNDGFGGLMGSFGEVPKAVGAKAKGGRALDPFDPFGDDEDAGLAALSIAPTVHQPRPVAPSPSVPALRSIPVAKPSPPVLAPQPRGMSTLTSPLDDDSFDDFLSSPVLPASQATYKQVDRQSSKTSLPPAPLRSFVSPPPIPSVVSPTLRPSTMSPPPSSAIPRAATFFAPPPPPSQPLRGFGISPPPSSTSSSKPPVAALKPPAAPARASSGPLSFDDFAFFES